jgi:hypothetical protein
MNKTRSQLHIFFKNELITTLNLTINLYQLNRSRGFYSFFSPVRFASAQLTSSPPFALLGATSPLADIIMPPCRVMSRFLPIEPRRSHYLGPLHLLATFCPVASPQKSKLKHSIRTTVIGYPFRTIRLPLYTAIKR